MLLPRCLLRCVRPAEERVKEPYKGVTTNYFLFRSTRALAQVGAGLHKNYLVFLGGAGPPHSRFGLPCSVCDGCLPCARRGFSSRDAAPKSRKIAHARSEAFPPNSRAAFHGWSI